MQTMPHMDITVYNFTTEVAEAIGPDFQSSLAIEWLPGKSEIHSKTLSHNWVTN